MVTRANLSTLYLVFGNENNVWCDVFRGFNGRVSMVSMAEYQTDFPIHQFASIYQVAPLILPNDEQLKVSW